MKHPEDGKCPIWGTEARTHRNSALTWLIDSPRAGGGYIIDLLTYNSISLERDVSSRLSTWIIDEHRAGEPYPVVTPQIIEMVSERRPLRLSERINRFFLYLSSRGYRPGSGVDMSAKRDALLLLAWTESYSASEFTSFQNILISSKLIEPLYGDIMLMPAGYERLEQAEQFQIASRQAFVAMWFGEPVHTAYEEGIAPAVEAAGFVPFRIDRKEHANKIDDEIVAEIQRSRFLIADFTCPIIETAGGGLAPNARGGVYYEAGLAQGIGIPVIWSVREDCLGYVHFDTRQFAHIVWKDPLDLRERLTNRIRAVIGQEGARA